MAVPGVPDPVDRNAMQQFEAGVVQAQSSASTGIMQGDRISLTVLDLAADAEDRVRDLSDASPDRTSIACRAGCSACCRIAVSLTAPEAIRIAEQLRSTLTESELAAVRERIRRTSQRVSHLTLEERARAKTPCALLGDDGACTIYDVRPIGCRGWTSFSREACDRALEQGIVGHGAAVDRIAFSAAGCVTEGLEAAMRTAGLDAQSYEFHSAVLRALDAKDAARRWINGENAFADCRRVVSDALRR